MMKIVTVVGARPQFIKSAVVSKQLANHSHQITELLVHTGQHFDDGMNTVFFQQMNIKKPDYQLNINSLSHSAMVGKMMVELEEVFITESPDLVMVYGDTNSTLAAALTASALNVPVAHVEAGLRSWDRTMPEELNRVLTDRVSSYLLCPTHAALSNLQQEGYDHFPANVHLVGDVMLDALQHFLPRATPPAFPVPESFGLVTIHRQGNTADRKVLSEVIQGIHSVAASIPLVVPLHPGTSKRLSEWDLSLSHPGILVVEPVGYLESLWLLQNCTVVLTDSGGLQKEAAFMGKPCVTLRNETEWKELLEVGVNKLAGNTAIGIAKAFIDMVHQKIDPPVHLFGGGGAAKRIADILLNSGL